MMDGMKRKKERRILKPPIYFDIEFENKVVIFFEATWKFWINSMCLELWKSLQKATLEIEINKLPLFHSKDE